MEALQLTGLDPAALPVLQALLRRVRSGASLPDLASELTDEARGGGRQAVVASRLGEPVGCAGWVTFGIEDDGRLYGSPVVAAESDVAQRLVEALVLEGRRLQATHLRISAWEGEAVKAAVLAARGFVHLFDWVTVARRIDAPVAPDFAAEGLACVRHDDIDWPRLADLYAAVFRGVPNAPALDAETLATQWSDTDWDASALLADAAGRYVAFVIVHGEGEVVAVGVDASRRGTGLADRLYRHAGHRLSLKGVAALEALVSSANPASLRFHEKLGFAESAPRGAVWELAL